MASTPLDPASQPSETPARPDREAAENAVRTLIRWAGDDPTREGLLDTPARVVRAYEEFFAGYLEDPVQLLSRTFGEVDGYDEMVVMTDIRFESHCGHHMVPIIGKAHVAYLPDRRVVDISKHARLVDLYVKRLQIQESGRGRDRSHPLPPAQIPCERNYRTRLLPRVSDAKSLFRIGMSITVRRDVAFGSSRFSYGRQAC